MKSSKRRVFLATKTSRRTRKEPAREDYASDEQDLFDRDWATWRELRDSNNEAVSSWHQVNLLLQRF